LSKAKMKTNANGKVEITVTGRSEKELEMRIKDNEKRGWMLVAQKNLSETLSNWDVPATSFRNSKKTRIRNNFLGSQDIKKFQAVMEK
jgi:hypothetical protein